MKIRDKGVLNDEEIAYLFEQARLQEQVKEQQHQERIKNMGLLGITPEELKKIPIAHDRRLEESKFRLLNELYVLPLMEKAKRVSNHPNLTFKTPEKLSIYKRCKALFHYIVKKEREAGREFTIEQLYDLIPQSNIDSNILIQARRMNFNLGFEGQESIQNYDRVSRAREHLIRKGVDLSEYLKENEKYTKESLESDVKRK